MQQRFYNFGLMTEVVKNLLIINGLFFVANIALLRYDISLFQWFNLSYFETSSFKPFQIITHMFMHADMRHLLINMFGLWMFGTVLERMLGPKRFLILYFASGLFGSILQTAFFYYDVQMNVMNAVPALLGASGAVSGIFAAFATLEPNRQVLLFFVVPVKVKFMAYFLVVYSVFSHFFVLDNIAHMAHLGGMIAAFALVKYWNKTNRTSFY
jgi:rhomboid-like protein